MTMGNGCERYTSTMTSAMAMLIRVMPSINNASQRLIPSPGVNHFRIVRQLRNIHSLCRSKHSKINTARGWLSKADDRAAQWLDSARHLIRTTFDDMLP